MEVCDIAVSGFTGSTTQPGGADPTPSTLKVLAGYVQLLWKVGRHPRTEWSSVKRRLLELATSLSPREVNEVAAVCAEPSTWTG